MRVRGVRLINIDMFSLYSEREDMDISKVAMVVMMMKVAMVVMMMAMIRLESKYPIYIYICSNIYIYRKH